MTDVCDHLFDFDSLPLWAREGVSPEPPLRLFHGTSAGWFFDTKVFSQRS